MLSLSLCLYRHGRLRGRKKGSFTQILSGWSTKGNVQIDWDQRNRSRATNPAEKGQDEFKILFSGE